MHTIHCCVPTIINSQIFYNIFFIVRTAINIGFEQERYTVFEADVSGLLTRIPIVKENDQESELTFEVIATLILGSGFGAARVDLPGQDFAAIPRVQFQDFDPDEQVIEYLFGLIDDSVPEPIETFQIQLSLANVGLTSVNLEATGGSLFATATIVIIDDDGKLVCRAIVHGSENFELYFANVTSIFLGRLQL